MNQQHHPVSPRITRVVTVSVCCPDWRKDYNCRITTQTSLNDHLNSCGIHLQGPRRLEDLEGVASIPGNNYWLTPPDPKGGSLEAVTPPPATRDADKAAILHTPPSGASLASEAGSAGSSTKGKKTMSRVARGLAKLGIRSISKSSG